MIWTEHPVEAIAIHSVLGLEEGPRTKGKVTMEILRMEESSRKRPIKTSQASKLIKNLVELVIILGDNNSSTNKQQVGEEPSIETIRETTTSSTAIQINTKMKRGEVKIKETNISKETMSNSRVRVSRNS